MSGHLFFGERWYGFDDAMYTAARLLEILSRHDDPSALLDALPTSFSTPELNVPCAEGEHHAVVAELLARAADGRLAFDGGEVGTIDGLRVDFADGFGLIRASNTTPVLVLRFEGHTPEALHRIEAQFMAALRSVKPDAQVAAGRALSAARCCAGAGAPRWRAPPTRRCCAWPRRVYLARLWWRGRREPLYRQRLARAPGRLPAASAPPGGCGCTPSRWARPAPPRPLIDALRRQRPGLRLLLTHGTATGREAGAALLREGDAQAWLPYDTPGAVRRFLRRTGPPSA